MELLCKKMISQDPINTLESLISKNKTKSLSLYLVILLGLLLTLLLLPIINLDITSQSRGLVRSHQDKVPLQSLVSGRVVHIKLKNNQWVQKGDTLAQLAQDQLATERQSTEKMADNNQLLINDLHNACKGITQFSTSMMVQEWQSYSTKKNELKDKLHFATQDYLRYKKLFDKGVLASAEYEKYQLAHTTAQQSIAVLEKNQLAQWENRLTELTKEANNLSASIRKIQTESKNYYIIAPVSGSIENATGLQPGSFLNASQPLAYITPLDNLIVECTVLPNDIGLLHKGQAVRFQLDAFNYNQWGLAEGKILDIDKNITLQENQAFFKVRCSLFTKQMQLKSGFKTTISNGMTLTARYIITRRSLYDLLFDKVDDWLNPKLNKPTE